MKIHALATAALLAVTATPALAQRMTVFGYNVNASLRARLGPSYEGSDRYTIGPAGGLSLSKPGAPILFSAPDDSASLTLAGDDKVTFGLAGRLRPSRGDKDELTGMRKIGWGVEAGVFGNLWLADWLRTRLEVRSGIGAHSGVLADLGADAVYRHDRWIVSAGPRFSYADTRFTRTYFGVTPAEALASPAIAAAYSPRGGPRYAGLVASADYRWSDRWRLTADAGYRRVLGDAADSPLVRDLGSADQFDLSLGVRYAIGQ